MLVALPIVLASGFFKLLALTADITLSQVYTASAVVFYSHRLARTAAESVMPLPMPSYVQEGSGFVPGDLALFAALSPVVTPFEQSSPTFGDCVNVISSSFLSLVRDSLALVSSVPLPGFPAAPTSVTPKFLTLEPPAGAPDPPQIHNVSAHPAFGPHYLDFILVSSLAPVPARFASIPSELGWRSLGSEDAHLVLAGPVRAKPAVVPNTCTPSTPVSCGLGDYHHGSRIASCSPNTNFPVSPKLGMCARASEDAHGISTDSMSNWLGLDSRATGNHNYQHPPTFVPPIFFLSRDVYVPSSPGSCGRGSELFCPPTRVVALRWDLNASDPSTFGSCRRGAQSPHSPRAVPVPIIWKVLNMPRMVIVCYCLALLALVVLRRHAEQLYLDAPAYLFQVGKSPTKGNCALNNTDQGPRSAPTAPPTPTPAPHGAVKRGGQPDMHGVQRKRPWIRKLAN